MRLFKYTKNDDETVIKILEVPVYKQTEDYVTAARIQSFLNGFITTTKSSKIECEYSIKEIKVLNKSIIKRVEEDNYRTYFFLGKEYKKLSLIKEFETLYLKYFNEKYDDIYILRANSGEIYLTLTYLINSYIKKNGSKNPLLVATQKYHVDLIKMICPDLPYIYIKKLNLKIVGDEFKINNFRFFLLFDSMHFRKVEFNIKSNELGTHHYFKSILDRLNLTEKDIQMRKINVLPNAEQSMLEKVQNIGLNLNKFVFLAPEAQSCKLYDEEFWIILINKFQDMGYDVFVNLVDNEIKLATAKNFKTCDLTFSEAFSLAQKSKKIISLRSGFTEFLLQTGVPMAVLYTKFKHRQIFNDMDIYRVMSGFGLLQLPYIDKNKIQEFNTFEVAPVECIEQIVKELKYKELM